MGLYPPLKFIEQIEEYFRLTNSRELEAVVNNKAIKFVEEYMKTNRSQLFHDYGSLREIGDINNEEILTRYNDLYFRFCKMLRIQGGMESVNDFFDLLVYYDIRNIWRMNKLSYLVDNDLFRTLLNMELPRLAPIDCMTKLPANCFYIDYNGVGDEICEDLEGSFVVTDEVDDELNIILVHLVNSNVLNRMMLITTVFRLPLGDSDKFIPSEDGRVEGLSLVCEDGVTRVINERKLCKFFFNFLIYLHAANRDIVVSERTRKNHEKPVAQVKNKFREVKEFEVGFSYGRTIKQGSSRIKYIGKKQEMGVGSPKSSHYRSAHWHHYWTGSGDSKELIIKWVEGVFVNGGKDVAESINIHKVK